MMKVAVRTLCEFAAREGSLEHRYTPSPTADEGIKGHKALQARRPASYQPEYLLEGECAGIRLRGKADGYVTDKSVPTLEEIKTHRGDLARVGIGQRQLHMAQLKVYGALLCLRDNLSSVNLRLVYYDITKDFETPLDKQFDSQTLITFLSALCLRYHEWYCQESAHRKRRDESLMHLAFPFPEFRTHQRSLSENVYKSISIGLTLLLEAPTGIGKTLGVAYPALMAMPRRKLDRLFILTARTTGRQLILDSLAKLKPASDSDERLPLRILELTAKEKVCEYPDRSCHGESCPLAQGFFDRLPAARQAAIEAYWLDQTQIKILASSHHICPYFLSQEMARWSDVVIGDVNHYFDQQAILYGLTRQNGWRVVPLIDEAHNLIDRARGMYSAQLNQHQLRKTALSAPDSLKKPIRSVQRAWSKLIKQHIDGLSTSKINDQLLDLNTVPTELNTSLQRLVSDLTEYMTDHPVVPELQSLLFDTLSFMKLTEHFGDHSLCTLSIKQRTTKGKRPGYDASLWIRNLIPADFLTERFTQAHANILFSATLNPAEYYQDLLGLPENALWKTSPSPFSSTQLDLRIVNLSTRFNDREGSIKPIIERIEQQFRSAPGNYLVYLSSFAYLDLLTKSFKEHCSDILSITQISGMNETDRVEFIQQFRNHRGIVGFAVLGGAFSEGIDLPGDALVGVFIATLGLPPFDHYHDQLAIRLQSRFQQGYRYTYLYPGIRKVVQAAGRLIRTPQDTGIIELIDDRFDSQEVNALLPEWWRKSGAE
ncbi:ATP-dependent DNA helicase [Marinomonas foliarum]|nr:ATP-dependent DNA helicase [Marinomonas foliarum]